MSVRVRPRKINLDPGSASKSDELTGFGGSERLNGRLQLKSLANLAVVPNESVVFLWIF